MEKRKISLIVLLYMLISIPLIYSIKGVSGWGITSQSGTYENLTTYTENDASNRFSATATRLTISNLDLTDTDHYFYKDYGTNHFSNFTHSFEFNISYTDTVGNSRKCIIMSYINYMDDYLGFFGNASNGVFFGIFVVEHNTTHYRLQLFLEEGHVANANPKPHNVAVNGDTIYFSEDIEYYGTIEKEDRWVHLYIWESSSRETISSITSIYLFDETENTDFRYFAPAISMGYHWESNSPVSGYIENIDMTVVFDKSDVAEDFEADYTEQDTLNQLSVIDKYYIYCDDYVGNEAGSYLYRIMSNTMGDFNMTLVQSAISLTGSATHNSLSPWTFAETTTPDDVWDLVNVRNENGVSHAFRDPATPDLILWEYYGGTLDTSSQTVSLEYTAWYKVVKNDTHVLIYKTSSYPYWGSVWESQVLNDDWNFTLIQFGSTMNETASTNGHGDFALGYVMFEGENFEGEELYPQPELVNVTINGFIEGEYLFEGEVYEIDSYWNNTDYCYFQLDDTEHIWEYFYYNESQYMGIDVTDFEGLITNELVIGCPYVYIDDNFTGVEENLTRLKWKFILNTQVVDCFNRTLSYYGENQWGNVTSGDTAYDEINIYNLGGYVTYDIVGDAGRLTKGDAWELWAENGTVGNPSYAYAETIFRKLQHVHFLVEIDLDLEWNAGNNEFDFDGGGYVEYGIDYRLNQIWVTGWKVKIYPQLATSIDVGNHGAGDDQNWIYWSIEWYYNDTLEDQDFIYSNCYGYDHVDSNHGYTNRTSAQLWVDLWFNKMNASTVVGGRVNSYYYGCYEQGNPWWFGYGAFRPMTGDIDASMYFDDLKDINGTVFTCQKLEIIRAWAKVTKWDYTPDSQDTRWEIKTYEILNFLTAQDRMMGVDTPIFVQTKILEVTTQHGFLQSLYIAITGLGATIWKGALGFTKIFVGAIDSLLMFLGLPEGTFTSLTQMIMMQFTQFLTWMTYLVAQVSNMLSVFSGMISFILQIITNVVSAILWIFENAIAFPINVMKLLVAILNGETITLWGRLWDFTSAYGFIEAGKEMLPYSIGVMFMFWLLYGNVSGEGDEDLHGFPRRVLDMFGWFKEIYQNVFFIFNRIRNELISMYNFIRSHIPSMGGGGGETEE